MGGGGDFQYLVRENMFFYIDKHEQMCYTEYKSKRMFFYEDGGQGGENMGTYICIDLKSFYASVECVDRGLDPLDTALLVADRSRTDKTICLAVSPALKAFGVPGRPRLFEAVEIVAEVDRRRAFLSPGGRCRGKSRSAAALAADPTLAVDYIVAPPRMARYMEVSTQIYQIYLRHIAPEDIHVYSVDEVFIDAGPYLRSERCDAHTLALRLVREVLQETGITATAGIGTDLYLAKVAMDIVAKKMPPDRDGVRIAALDEASYRRTLWDHRPLTDFWRIGSGTARRLARLGLYTMGDVAAFSEHGEDTLWRIFGKHAELLIDHAWGWEPCTMQDIKAYRPARHSLSRGQVLPRAYSFEEARLIVREMAEQLATELVRTEQVTEKVVLSVGYDRSGIPEDYDGPMSVDHYGRRVPASTGGSARLGRQTDSARLISQAMTAIFLQTTDASLRVRRLCLAAEEVVPLAEAAPPEPIQYSLFDDVEALEQRRAAEDAALAREHRMQEAVIYLKERFGKNAVFRGMDLEEAATTRERNAQVGGHRA